MSDRVFWMIVLIVLFCVALICVIALWLMFRYWGPDKGNWKIAIAMWLLLGFLICLVMPAIYSVAVVYTNTYTIKDLKEVMDELEQTTED